MKADRELIARGSINRTNINNSCHHDDTRGASRTCGGLQLQGRIYEVRVEENIYRVKFSSGFRN